MKSKKNVFAAALTFVLALSIVTVSATAASANEKKPGAPANDPCIAAAEASGECVGQPLEGFVKNLSFLSEQEKSALLADLAEIERYEDRISGICSRMTDENADKLYGEIDKIEAEITKVLERNAELWERVNDEYDEKIAAKEPDMTLDPAEEDFNGHCTEKEETYEESIKGMTSLTAQEKAALLADLTEIEALEKRVDTLYASIKVENSDRLYDEIDALEDKIAEILVSNAEFWVRVDAEYDENEQQRKRQHRSRNERKHHSLGNPVFVVRLHSWDSFLF